jgi:lactate dehydrogenase-like 2-hydroxyacid dehydrogenase
VDLTRLLRESDFIVLCVPLSKETTKLLGPQELKLTKPTAIIVNASRGAVIDESALIEALQEGRIAAAGLDVFEEEPVQLTNPLLAMDNVLTLPHVGSATEATRQTMVDLAVENILAVLKGERALTPVNETGFVVR